MNKKGFTMVELLGTVVILGILISIGIATYSGQRERSARKSYNLIHSGAASAAENYFMDYPSEDEVTIEKLVEDEYLESAKDPWDGDHKCTGKVDISSIEGDDEDDEALELHNYRVQLKCIKGCTCLVYPNKTPCDCEDEYNG